MMAHLLGNMIGQEHQQYSPQQCRNIIESVFGNDKELNIFLRLDCQSVRLIRAFCAGQRVRGVNAFATTSQCLYYLQLMAIRDCSCSGFWIDTCVKPGIFGLNGMFCSGCGDDKDSHQDFQQTVKLFDLVSWLKMHFSPTVIN